MNPKTLPIELLHGLLTCDPIKGELFWKERIPEMFFCTARRSQVSSCRAWNTMHAGKRAFDIPNPQGYKRGQFIGHYLLAHRVIWAMHYGEWPLEEIDHINGDRADNRIVNLRSVTPSDNQRNKAISANNKSGVHGVRWCKFNKRWVAQIKSGKKTATHLGNFLDIESAIAARKKAEIERGFHPNHGRKQ